MIGQGFCQRAPLCQVFLDIHYTALQSRYKVSLMLFVTYSLSLTLICAAILKNMVPDIFPWIKSRVCIFLQYFFCNSCVVLLMAYPTHYSYG